MCKVHTIHANGLTANSSLLDFDLSQIKSLRTLELRAHCIIHREPLTPDPAALNFLTVVLSTITSPTFSNVVVFYGDAEFGGVTTFMSPGHGNYRFMMPDETAEEASWHCRLFEVFREMHAIRDLQLVLCADVWDPVGEYTMGVLKQAIAVEAAAKRLDYLHSEPLVVCSPRASRDPRVR